MSSFSYLHLLSNFSLQYLNKLIGTGIFNFTVIQPPTSTGSLSYNFRLETSSPFVTLCGNHLLLCWCYLRLECAQDLRRGWPIESLAVSCRLLSCRVMMWPYANVVTVRGHNWENRMNRNKPFKTQNQEIKISIVARTT